MSEWYHIDNVNELDSPWLVVYPDRVLENIRLVKSTTGDTNRLRPHVKTHKSINVTRLLLQEGITKFKCATIAEAEMLGMAGVPDVLLAYQPVGPKIERLADLVYEYPGTTYSCLIDSLPSAKAISDTFQRYKLRIPVYVDLNVGMNRTGILPGPHAEALYAAATTLPAMDVLGLHAYDGHLRDKAIEIRKSRCDEAFAPVQTLADSLKAKGFRTPQIVVGGSPTFPIHATRKNVECSPGTFVYWDAGYSDALPEQAFLPAAVVITRIVSKPTDDTICIDLGHKSIASENPLDRRIRFLNATALEPVSQSEEHMVLRNAGTQSFSIGDVLYGIPYHICPTCALYDAMSVVTKGHASDRWPITARGRRISI